MLVKNLNYIDNLPRMIADCAAGTTQRTDCVFEILGVQYSVSVYQMLNMVRVDFKTPKAVIQPKKGNKKHGNKT
jgi:hypothetical protein